MNAIALIEDGRRDFDFLYGEWTVAHRRLKRRGVDCQEWEDFGGTTVCRSLMGGICNADENHTSERGHAGVTFRAFISHPVMMEQCRIMVRIRFLGPN